MKYVNVDTENSITKIILDRPDIHNAFDPEMIQNITIAFENVNDDPKTRVVILTGNGRSFSSGANINWMKESKNFTYEKNVEDAKELERMFNTIYSCSKPVIGRINGHAFGGGVGLIAVCDIAIAVERAKFGLTEVNLGIIPAVISPYVIQKIGLNNASRYFLTGERFTARVGEKIGLFSQVVPNEETLDDIVNDLSNNLLTSGPRAITAAKELIFKNRTYKFEELREFCIKEIARLRTSDEGKEGLSSFLEKRKPSWIEVKK